jgi:hypothetical protein
MTFNPNKINTGCGIGLILMIFTESDQHYSGQHKNSEIKVKDCSKGTKKFTTARQNVNKSCKTFFVSLCWLVQL